MRFRFTETNQSVIEKHSTGARVNDSSIISQEFDTFLEISICKRKKGEKILSEFKNKMRNNRKKNSRVFDYSILPYLFLSSIYD